MGKSLFENTYNFHSNSTGFNSSAILHKKFLVTAGSDGKLAIINTDKLQANTKDDYSLVFTTSTASPITSLSVFDNLLATTSIDHEAILYTYEENLMNKKSLESPTTIVRSSLPIRQICFDYKGKFVAIASDDIDIKIISVSDITQVVVLKGHKRGVKSLCFDPKGDYLASVDSDGTVNFWDVIELSSSKLVNYQNLSMKALPSTNNLCRMSWHPSGDFIAIPGNARNVVIIEKESWKTIATIGKHPDMVNQVAWSANGAYLAASSMDGTLSIWHPEFSIIQPIKRMKNSSYITDISWHPIKNMFCAVDIQGRIFCSPNEFISSRINGRDFPNPVTRVPSWEFSDAKVLPKTEKALGDSLFNEQRNVQEKKGISDDEDEYFDNEVEEDFIIDDDGAGYVELGDAQEFNPMYVRKDRRKEFQSETTSRSLVAKEEWAFQDAFQPGSTPQIGNRQYLAFNLVGVLYSISQGSHSIMQIEFHDKSQKSISFPDHYNYNIGCLGESGAVFGCVASGGNPGSIYYRPFENPSKNEWHAPLLPNEDPKVVAVSNRWIAVATDSRYIRFFGYGGLQAGIKCTLGDVVSMVGGGDYIFIVYHDGAPFQGNQKLEYMIIDKNLRVVAAGGLPINPESTLKWIGFSDERMPCTFDSSGVLRMASISDQYSWTPVLDTRILNNANNVVDWYWPVGVFNGRMMCIICKAGDKYPSFPIPLINEAKITSPFLLMENDLSGVLEEEHFRKKFLYDNFKDEKIFPPSKETETDKIKRETDLDKTAIKLQVKACQAGKSERAVDISRLMNLENTLNGAMKVAIHYQMPVIAARINVIKEDKANELKQKSVNSGMLSRYDSMDYSPEPPKTTRKPCEVKESHHRMDLTEEDAPAVEIEHNDMNMNDDGDSDNHYSDEGPVVVEPKKKVKSVKLKSRNPFPVAPKTPEENNAAATIFSTLQQVALKEEEDQLKKRKLKNVDADKSKINAKKAKAETNASVKSFFTTIPTKKAVEKVKENPDNFVEEVEKSGVINDEDILQTDGEKIKADGVKNDEIEDIEMDDSKENAEKMVEKIVDTSEKPAKAGSRLADYLFKNE